VLFAQHSAATRGFRAARDTKPAIRFFDNDLRLIAIKGAVIDEVDVIYPDGLSIYRMKDRGWDIFCRSASARDVYGGIQNRLRAFRSTIMLGQQAFISDNMWPADADVREEELDDGDGGGGGPEESLEAPQRTSATPLDADVEVSGDDAGDGHLGKMQEHSLTNSLKCPYYPSRFFITRRGYSGRGPLSAQKGDAVVLFWGGKVPVILRKLKDGDAQGQQHLMLGECCESSVLLRVFREELTSRYRYPRHYARGYNGPGRPRRPRVFPAVSGRKHIVLLLTRDVL